jgi:hypothetical protein
MSKLFEKIYQTANLQSNPIMKRLSIKGYTLVILGNDADRELPDVHGIPPGYEAYGRCGVYRDGQLYLTGGTSGDPSGHDASLKWGGYWGTKEVKGQGIIFVRGRAGVSERDITAIEVPLIDAISRKIPRV